MVKLEEMSREDLIEVIRMKDELLKELKEEIAAYRALVEELQIKLGLRDYNFSGHGD
ncbi:MAG: hypothetical protein GX384_04920 [Clostridiaceae bacterium]|jgi:hypothetical protein|nr:hypothetical protein [Bacillota bacterium]NLI38674.1 hypothetical protein [Clostridiaceae bacterium]